MASLRITGGPAAGTTIALGDEVLFGRTVEGPGAVPADTDLSRRHARFSPTPDGRIVVEDLGSTNGTYVNGTRIQGPQLVRPGDQVRMGGTTVELVGVEAVPEASTKQRAVPQQPPTVAAPAGAGVPAAVGPPAAAAGPPAGGFGQPATPFPSYGQPAAAQGAQAPLAGGYGLPPRRRGVALFVVLAILVAGVAGGVVGFVLKKGGSTTTPKGSGPGLNSPTIDGPVALTAYVESNMATSNQNTVLVLRWAPGSLKPYEVASFPTGGSGSADLTDSGVLDADQQVITNRDHTLLFAVNQGSDTIAVFKIQGNGNLEAVDGSPFPSGGKAPVSLALSGNVLVVLNKAQDGIRDLSDTSANITTLRVGSDGSLKPIPDASIKIPPGSSPTQALISPNGKLVFESEESGPLRAFVLGSDGRLKQGPNSPLKAEPSLFPPGFPDAKKFALGLIAHPTKPLVYASYPTVPALAVYSYTADGRLKFLRAVPNVGSVLPCWNVISKDGRWVYTNNAGNTTVTVFDTSDPVHPKQIQLVANTQAGNPWNFALDPSGKYLVSNTPRDTFFTPPGQGNVEQVYRVKGDGTLEEVEDAIVKLPVPENTNPQGIVVLSGS